MKLRIALLTACAALALSLAVQISILSNAQPTKIYIASWADRPESIEETTDLAESVVQARVRRIRPAQPLEVSIEGGEVDRVPVEVITLEVIDEDLKGNRQRGTEIELFRTGHSGAATPDKRSAPQGPPPPRPEEGAVERSQAERQRGGAHAHGAVLFSAMMDDPPYQVGETYVLFVREGPRLRVDGTETQTRAIVAPEGRWRVRENNTLEPMSSRDFAQQLRGRPVQQLKERAAARATVERGQKPRSNLSQRSQ
jgi:hypothetical protein